MVVLLWRFLQKTQFELKHMTDEGLGLDICSKIQKISNS